MFANSSFLFSFDLMLVKYFSIKFLLEQPIPTTNATIVFVGIYDL